MAEANRGLVTALKVHAGHYASFAWEVAIGRSAGIGFAVRRRRRPRRRRREAGTAVNAGHRPYKEANAYDQGHERERSDKQRPTRDARD